MVSTAWKNLPWPFKHQQVALNRDTNLLKLIAMITMLIDHTGKMFFGNNPTMRIIGRMAFPIYAYCIALGCVYSRDRLKYLKRIVMIGLISQPLYAVALGHSVKAMYASVATSFAAGCSAWIGEERPASSSSSVRSPSSLRGLSGCASSHSSGIF